MSEIKGEFTGTWIPAHIMLDQSLNGSSKILYATIASFKKCYMSNETLGELIGTTPRNVQKLLKPLRDKGYIRQVAFNGKTRTLVPCRDEQMDVADTNKSSPNITINNTKNNNTMSVSKTNTTKKKEEEDFIQELHLLLEGKRPLKALDDYRKQLQARLKTFSYEEIREATRNLSYDDYNMGREDRNPNKYATVEYILRDNKKIEKYLQSDSGSTPDPENRGKLKVNKESINWEEV